jgi:hypothetical protein
MIDLYTATPNADRAIGGTAWAPQRPDQATVVKDAQAMLIQ